MLFPLEKLTRLSLSDFSTNLGPHHFATTVDLPATATTLVQLAIVTKLVQPENLATTYLQEHLTIADQQDF